MSRYFPILGALVAIGILLDRLFSNQLLGTLPGQPRRPTVVLEPFQYTHWRERSLFRGRTYRMVEAMR